MTAEAPRNSKIARAVHPIFFDQYDPFLQEMKSCLEFQRLHVVPQKFPDGSVLTQFMVGDGTTRSIDQLPITTIVPYWLIDAGGHNVREAYAVLDETLDALAGKGGVQISDNIVVSSPYLGVRTDHPSHDADGNEIIGEALYARMLASTLAKYNPNVKLITSELHSWDAANFLSINQVPHLNLTTAPLIGQHLTKEGLIDRLTSFVSLDLGTLQRNWRIVKLLGLDPREYLVIYEKERDDNGKLSTRMLYPDLETLKKLGKKRALPFDDVIDTSTSMKNNIGQLATVGFVEARMLSAHATLSYPARKEITRLLSGGYLKGIVTTNSLPTARFQFEDVEEIKVLDWVPILSLASIMIASGYSIQEINANPEMLMGTEFESLIPYIMPPLPKQTVWENFKREFNVP